MQLEAAQREVRTTQGRAESATHELGAKLRQQRRQWAKEKAALKQAEALGLGLGLGLGLRTHGGGLTVTVTLTLTRALKQAEAARGRMVEALRHELERLRRERETALPLAGTLLGGAASYHESCCASSSVGGGALGGGALGGGGGALPAELQRLVAEDRQLQAGGAVGRVAPVEHSACRVAPVE